MLPCTQINLARQPGGWIRLFLSEGTNHRTDPLIINHYYLVKPFPTRIWIFSASLKLFRNQMNTWLLTSVLPLVIATLPVVVLIYRSPPMPNSAFFAELSERLTLLRSTCPAMVVLGDLNIPVDRPECSSSASLASLLENFGLKQHIDFATHNRGHTLDLICTAGVEPSSIEGTVSGLSDHILITCDLEMPRPPASMKRTIRFKNQESVDTTLLSSAMTNLPTTDYVATFNSHLGLCFR